MKRVFLGIDLPANIKQGIEGLKNKNHLKDLPIKLVEAENSHIALNFFGDLTNDQIYEVIQLTEDYCQALNQFDIAISNISAFPGWHNPKVLILQVKSEKLIKIGNDLKNIFNDLPYGEKERRGYVPHLTLGRFNSQITAEQVDKIKTIIFQNNFTVNEFILWESNLTSRGPIYSALKTFKLHG